MNKPDKRLESLEDFLADTEGEPQAETLRELRAQGVDTKQFFQRVQKTVDEGYSRQLRELAAREQQRQTTPSFLDSLSEMGRAAMLDCFERIRSGALGGRYQQAAVARFRNKDASELTDEELRSWLEDIGETLGEPDE